ncbi:glycosyltransferase family 2 protein [Streptococcus hyovaginalis]
MLVSIITVYYNREDYISESINSLLNQTYKNIEIIAVDDGSTDKTYEKLKAIDDPRLKVYTQKNKGFVNTLFDEINKYNGGLIAIDGWGNISLPNRIQDQ